MLFDLRGLGLSTKIKSDYTLTEDIIRFYLEPIELLRLYFDHEKITIIGHSFGGYLAMLYSSYCPTSVNKVIAFSAIGK